MRHSRKYGDAWDEPPTLVGKDLKDVALSDFIGQRKVLNIVPSLDTPVCATSTRKFNESASTLNNTINATAAQTSMCRIWVSGNRTLQAPVP